MDRSEKVKHVLKSKQDRDHPCHGQMPGCAGQCTPARWGCRNCWFKLPKYLRDKIWDAYRPGQEVNMTPSREYLDVAEEVDQWIREKYPESR